MKISELLKQLNEMDGDAYVHIIKQHDAEYQSIYEIKYINEKHPIGGVCIHVGETSSDAEGTGN